MTTTAQSPAAPSSPTPSASADIHNAEETLREVLASGLREEASDSANSLERMLIHLVNMQRAIETTPASFSNVAKRLKDFSATASQMAAKHPVSAGKLEKLSEALRTASSTTLEIARTSDEAQRANAA
jgi:hypothetical protein